MKRIVFILLILPFNVSASGNGQSLDVAPIDLYDKESLQRGAENFANYCFNCHAISFMRFNRVAEDIGMTEDEVREKLMFTGAKYGDTMKIAMSGEDGKQWFGTPPPDLSVVSRSRGPNWLYTYLRSFYKDKERPWGVNNAIFKDVAMPHVLHELQGLQTAKYEARVGEDGSSHQFINGFELTEKGKLSPVEFDRFVADLVNFLSYVGEPAKTTRLTLGKWVLGFLAVFFIVTYLLKKEYWKDVH